MKSPDEIKKGLKFCAKPDHPVINKCEFCAYGAVPGCEEALKKDSLAYIQQLEESKERLAQNLSDKYREAIKGVIAERDAAVEQLKEVDRLELFCCSHCKHEELDDFSCTTCIHMSNWEWIGVQEVK